MLDFWFNLFVLFSTSSYFIWLIPIICLGVVTAIFYLIDYIFRVIIRR